MARRGGSVEAGEHPLEQHLEQLEQAVLDWLEASNYNAAAPDKQRVMRKAALMPVNAKATAPEPYRLWRMCKQWNTLWWGGGISNQPHILMLEFMVCEAATAQFQDDLANMEKILRD